MSSYELGSIALEGLFSGVYLAIFYILLHISYGSYMVRIKTYRRDGLFSLEATTLVGPQPGAVFDFQKIMLCLTFKVI